MHGTAAYVPYIAEPSVWGIGEVTGGRVKINYVAGKNIFPVTWGERADYGSGVRVPKHIVRQKYLHLQHHKMFPDGTYPIENSALL